MIDAYRVSQVRAAEEELFAVLAEGALMQRAATGLAGTCARLLRELRGQVAGARVVLLVGAGNNGGDALWAGAMLRSRGCRVDAIALAGGMHAEGSAALAAAGGRFLSAGDNEVRSVLGAADLVLDGILGIGGRGALREPAAGMAALLPSTDAVVIAVDLPSGVDADTGEVAGAAVRADVTVTFGCLKPGLLLSPGRDNAGEVVLVDIGLAEALTHHGAPAARIAREGDVARFVAEPSEDAYKYSRGVVGIAAGSADYPGASLLCTAAARHANVGMVRYLDRGDGLARTVVDHYPDIVIDGTAPAEQSRASAWACGPGFAGKPSDVPTVRAVLAAHVPVVLDAGALQVVADDAGIRADLLHRREQGLPTVLTPHEGEFRRLAPGVLEEAPSRVDAAVAAASRLGAFVVLKGPGTVVASPTGGVRIDSEGTADLGVAGSGDVLTGLAGALLAGASRAQDLGDEEVLDCIASAVWLHGRAGRIAAAQGPVVATDLAESVRAAVQAVRFGVPA